MSHDASLLLSDPSERVADCIGAPFRVYRNRRGYEYDHGKLLSSAAGIATSASSEKLLRRLSKERAAFFQDHIADFPVPTQLLSDTLAEDWLAQIQRANEQLSTVATIQHGSEALVLHRSGRDMDQVSVLNAAFFSHEAPSEYQAGFAIQLSQGAPIRHIVRAGSTHCGVTPLVMAATRAELVLLQSVSALELGGEHSVHTHTLDLLQRFPLPTSVRHLSGTPLDTPSALCLGEDGRLYRFSGNRGVFATHTTATWPTAHAVTCTAHPQVCHLSTPQGAIVVDLRTPSLSDRTLWSSPCWAVVCPQAMHRVGHSLLASGPAEEAWLDIRMADRPFHRRLGQGNRCFAVCEARDEARDVWLGGTAGEAWLRLHGLRGGRPVPWGLAASADSATWLRQGLLWPGGAEVCVGLGLLALPRSAPRGVQAARGWLAVSQGIHGDVFVQRLASPGEAAAPVQRPAPLGLRAFAPHSPSSPAVWSRGHARRQAPGASLRHATAAVDRTAGASCPVGAQACLPAVCEDRLRRFDVLAVRPTDLRADPPPWRRTAAQEEDDGDGDGNTLRCAGGQLREVLVAQLRTRRGGAGLSLWEVAAALRRARPGGSGGSLRGLQRALRGADIAREGGVEERVVPARGGLSPRVGQGAYGDGLAVEADQHGEDRDRDGDDGGCGCREHGEVPREVCDHAHCVLAHRFVYYDASPRLEETETPFPTGQAGSHAVSQDLCLLLERDWVT